MNNGQLVSSAKTTWGSLLILLLCCLLAYWPLTFHLYSLKNDALNYFLPVRYQISEAISSGHLPFWSPYFNLGYPLHGDMQSGVWNPIVQLFSLLGPYTLQTLQYETLLYVYVSGVGMFFLTSYFFKDWKICLLAATSFMLCGFNSDSAQFLNWISSAAFLPFVFLYYYRTISKRSWRAAICCSLFLFLLFTTAYPADFILTCYLLLFLLVWHLFKNHNRTKKNFIQLTTLHFLIALLFLTLSLPALISYAQFLPVTERGSEATYKQVMSNPLHPGLLFSYLTPLPVWKASFAAVTDPLERNSYFGIITFALLLLSFFLISKEKYIVFFKWAFILSVIFSFGEFGGLRIASYYLLPLMNTFRHPANAKLFSIFFGCLLASFSLQQLVTGQVKHALKKYVWIILTGCFAVLLIWSFVDGITLFSFNFAGAGNIKTFLDDLRFSDLLLINIILQVPFLILIYYCLIKKFHIKWLLVAAVINATIHTMLFQPFTVVKKDSAAYIQAILNKVQRPGYPIPDINSKLKENSQNGNSLFAEIGASNMYNKKIGRIDYRITPSNLLTQNQFWANEKFRDFLFSYSLFYRADTVVYLHDTAKITSISMNRFVLLKNEAAKNLTTKTPASYSAVIKSFTPNAWQIEVSSPQPGIYCLFQNYYPRWQLFIDGKQQSIIQCNVSFMGFQLPAGKHLVAFQYNTSDLKIAFCISLVTLLILLVMLFFTGGAKPFSLS